MLASLNHSNVAAIYGFEESIASDTGQTSVRALVMELVEGPTLAERLAAGPLPLEDQRAVGTVGDDVLIFKGSSRESPDDWSPDGRYVIFIAEDDIWALPLEGERRPVRVTESPAVEREGQVSPDGRWIAYTSRESGRDEMFVQSFPKPLLKREAASSRVGVTMAASSSIFQVTRH